MRVERMRNRFHQSEKQAHQPQVRAFLGMPPAQQDQNKNQNHQRQKIGKESKIHRDPGIVAIGFDLNPRSHGMRLLPFGDRTSAITLKS